MIQDHLIGGVGNTAFGFWREGYSVSVLLRPAQDKTVHLTITVATR